MSPRSLALLCPVALLVACAGEPPPAPPVQPPPTRQQAPAPKPDHLREISGRLLGVPPGADVELALLSISERGLPQGTLGNIQLRGTGAALPFSLPFNPEAFDQGIRVELRGRVQQSGKLVLHLQRQIIRQPNDQDLGELRLTPAP